MPTSVAFECGGPYVCACVGFGWRTVCAYVPPLNSFVSCEGSEGDVRGVRK